MLFGGTNVSFYNEGVGKKLCCIRELVILEPVEDDVFRVVRVRGIGDTFRKAATHFVEQVAGRRVYREYGPVRMSWKIPVTLVPECEFLDHEEPKPTAS